MRIYSRVTVRWSTMSCSSARFGEYGGSCVPQLGMRTEVKLK